jgi:DNA-directed RNA polymerase specialized sigma24 family protein
MEIFKERMKTLSAFEFLNELKKIDAMIKNKEIEIEQWKSIATSSTVHSDGERVQSSGSKQKMADAVIEFVDIAAEVEVEKNRLIQKKRDIIRVIEQLPATQYDLLHKIYVQCFTLAEAADMEMKSYSWAKNVHRKGLANVQKILDERK